MSPLPLAAALLATFLTAPGSAQAAAPWGPPQGVGPLNGNRVAAELAFAPGGARLVAWTVLGDTAAGDRTRISFVPGAFRELGARLAAPPAASGPGRFTLLRENVFSGRRRLFASTVFAAGRLGGVTVLARDLVLDEAAQAANARGDVAVAWIERPRGQRPRVRLALRRRSRPFGPTRTLATGTLRSVAVAVNARGHLLVAYARRPVAGRWRIEARSGLTRAPLGVAQVLGPGRGADDVAAAIAPSGRGLVTWGAQDPGEVVDLPFVVFAAVRSPGTRVFGARQVLDAGGNRDRPEGRGVRVGTDRYGTLVVAWTQTESGGRVVRTRRSRPGGRFGPVTTFGASRRADALDADLAVAPDGRHALVWIEQRDLDQRVRAAVISRTGATSGPEVVGAYDDALAPRVAFAPHQGLTAVWTALAAPFGEDVRLAERPAAP